MMVVRRFALLGLVLACSAAPVLAQQSVAPSERVKRNVVVRAEPTTQSQALDALEPGERLELDGQVPGWFRVELPDGRQGYVSKTWTVIIGEAAGPLPAAGQMRLHVIDVGTGLAIFIEGPGFALVYDGGTQDDKASGADNRLIAYIRAVSPNLQAIDHLFLSHPHEDHQELLPDVLDRYEVRHVWDSGRVQQTVGYCRFLKKVETEPGVVYHAALTGTAAHVVSFHAGSCNGTVRLEHTSPMTDQPVTLGSAAKFTVLHRDSTPHADPNGNSVVVRLDYGSRSILLTGDAEGGSRQPPATPPSSSSIEAQLLRDRRPDLRADVLIVGHHGSLTSSRSEFLDAVGAEIFVISSGPHPYSGVVLPDPAIRTELKNRGRLLETTEGDQACRLADHKIGRDRDGKPGGCTNIIVTVGPGNDLRADYWTAGD